MQRLLDAVAAYLPSPLDKPPVVGHHPKKGTELTRKPSPDEPFCGLVFKITNDAHGDLSFVRIYSGRLKSGTRVYNPGKDKKEICSRLYHIRADDREQITEAAAGDIVGIVGPQGLGHRRHALRRRSTRSCSSGSSSPRRSSACRSSRSARPTRASWRRP